jgi:RHS repeat-associated protein
MRRTIILAALTACRLFAGETAKVAANATADFGDYTYDGAGNITGAGADRFTYDEYGRIKAAALTQGSTTITQSFGYDRYGNLLSIATTGDPTLVPAVDPLTNRINKLTATTNAFGSYDANGNLTSYNSSSSFAYDPLDVMSESTVGGQRRVYLYTAGNERIAVLEVTATGALTGSTWTLRDASAKVLRLSKDGAGTWRWDEDYIYRGAQLLAAEVPGNTLQFHLDHLGTPRVITGNGGARLSSHTYFPFGREVAFSTPDTEVMKFTGHERDDVNLDYMHARYYVPFAGRFLSVDPGRDWDASQPQSWNGYAYVRDNPLNSTDPDGRKGMATVAGALIGFVAGAIVEVHSQGWGFKQEVNYSKVGASAAGGATAGVVTTLCNCPAWAAGGAGGIIGGSVTKTLKGDKQTIVGAVLDGLAGGMGARAGQALGKKIATEATQDLVVKAAALRAESLANNAGLGADKVVQQQIKALTVVGQQAGDAVGNGVGVVQAEVEKRVESNATDNVKR